MSTEYNNIATKTPDKPQVTHRRFAKLAAMDEQVFHASDLANLWQIQNKNTLHTTLKRYAKQGLLHRVWKGMYSLNPPIEINAQLLGLKALHSHAYVSTETILFEQGVVSQKPSAITLVGPISRRFSIAGNSYYCRKLSDKHLYNPNGIKAENGISKASLERAIADILYFNPKSHFDTEIDWPEVAKIQQKIGYPINKKLNQFHANSKKRRC